MARSYRLIILGLFFSLILGCAGIKETARSIAGVSTKELERARPASVKKIFKFNYFSCYSKVKEALSLAGSYVYAENKKLDLIAIYVSQKDTTPVGIFLKEIDNANTQLEISSPSNYARDFIADKVFSFLESPDENGKEK